MIEQFVKFCVVGGSGVFVDFGVTYACKEWLRLNKYLANSLGFLCASTSNYLLNRLWTFQDRNSDIAGQYLRFLGIAAVGLLINNMVIGVSEGYKKELELVGVGYRVTNTGQLLDLSLGYTHNIYLQLPKEVKVETKTERNKNPLIILESADKQLLGQICAKIRSFRMPEPYKGKGIKFVGEEIRRKSGKSAGK